MTIKFIGSPNYDSNRKPIKRIIIHWFGVGNLASADAQFQKLSGTSAHYGIEDNVIHQYVKETDVAYHAGNYAINQESIGIEHSATTDRPASDATYETSGKLIAEICKRYNIPLTREFIEPHNKYRATQCPGTMDIDKLIKLAKTQEPMATITQKELDSIIKRRDDEWRTLDSICKLLDLEIDEDLNITYLRVLADVNRRKRDYDNKVQELKNRDSVTIEVPREITSQPVTASNFSGSTQEVVPIQDTKENVESTPTLDDSLTRGLQDFVLWLHQFLNKFRK